MQALGEQRVRAEDVGQLGGGAAVHDGLADPAHQRVVGAREQGHHDGDGTFGAAGVLDAGGQRLLVAGGALGGGVREDGLQRGELGRRPASASVPST
ncbi:hypothetical protein SMD44_08382 [Streptomyces alboflavus]|uniref:Uncharacterized protein n=1 Tax=Streptomyces alboflavus TaxID=67267 RepID=A0A1Z1WR35_9ACTN|nr:hypothetical protein SMD44_08382 [Streptomyces alboflavus]